jgi:hypothetical protein
MSMAHNSIDIHVSFCDYPNNIYYSKKSHYEYKKMVLQAASNRNVRSISMQC